jgi:hypothetical protein
MIHWRFSSPVSGRFVYGFCIGAATSTIFPQTDAILVKREEYNYERYKTMAMIKKA